LFVAIERDKKRFVVSVNARVHQLEKELARLKQDRDQLARERDEYRKLYELVMLELERVRRHLRAQNKSERVDAAQVQLAFSEIANLIVPPDLAEQIAEAENKARRREPTKPSKPHGRGKLPEHLPVERVELHPPESLRTCSCCGQAMHVIGEETSEQLDYRPASLVRVQTARMKYACGC
jgi:transposase